VGPIKGATLVLKAPSIDELRFAFTDCQERVQRRSDGTISVSRRRFEVPDRFRSLGHLRVRFATWDPN